MTPNDKRYDQYRRKCAKIHGTFKTDIPVMEHYYGGNDQQIGVRESRMDELPTYLDDASIDAVVRKLDGKQVSSYVSELNDGFSISDIEDAVEMFRATPEQKSEALCRTLMGGKE